MPNGNSRIIFNADYLKQCEIHITNCRTMFNRIQFKYKLLHINDLGNAIGTLQAIKNYAAANGARIPREPLAPITHDEAGNQFLNKGKLAVRQLYNAIPGSNQAQLAMTYRKALDFIVVFQSQLPKN